MAVEEERVSKSGGEPVLANSVMHFLQGETWQNISWFYCNLFSWFVPNHEASASIMKVAHAGLVHFGVKRCLNWFIFVI
jgi:hypothetical protein